MRSQVIHVTTGSRPAVHDLRRLAFATPACSEFVAGAGDGLLSVWVPHATAGWPPRSSAPAATST